MCNRFHSLIRLVALQALFVLGACNGTHDEPHTHDHQDAGNNAFPITGGQHDTYVMGLEKTGEKGLVVVRLEACTPIPEFTDIYTWELSITTADGEPLEDAKVIAEPRMPDHDHGTFPPFTEATVTATAGGYTLTDMDLFMAGIWEVRIRINLAEGDDDEVAYRFLLEG